MRERFEPLPDELIGRLEVAVHHRNRREALQIIANFFDAEVLQPSLDDSVQQWIDTKNANALQRFGIRTMRNLMTVNEQWLLNHRQIRAARVAEIRAGIKRFLAACKKTG